MEKRKFSVSANLLSAIIALIIGAILLTNPEIVGIIISYILGGILIFMGLISIIFYSYNKGKFVEYPNKDLFLGIAMVVIGLLCIFLSGVVEQFLRIVIGAIILISGINRFIKATYYSIDDKKVISLYVVAILLVVAGIYTIFKANLAIQGIGIILIVYSALEIIDYICSGFVKPKENVTTKTTVVTDDNKITTEAELITPKKKKKGTKKNSKKK